MEIVKNSEYVIYQNNIHKNNMDIALNIVKNYIIDHKLIIVGGMAIHLILQTKNLKLYDDHNIPDYDVYSDEFIYHADKLSNLLCSNKLPNISMIPAIHNTTIRVKMSGYTVFDITYIPKNLINKIPTVNFLDFKLIDPNYQKIDQYNSLSFLFEITGPTHNIFHRFKKDIDRNKLLVDNFILSNIDINIDFKTYKIPLSLLYKDNLQNQFNIYNNDTLINSIDDLNNEKINYIYENENSYFETNFNICLHGINAYSFYYKKIKLLITEFNKINKNNKLNSLFDTCVPAEINIIDIDNDLYLESTIPKNCPFTLINNNNKIEQLISNIKSSFNINEINKYNRVLDNKPISIICNNDNVNIEILDLYSNLLSTNITSLNFKNKKYNFIISNFNYILSYFLTNYYFNDTNNSLYLSYYVSLLHLINISKELYKIDNKLFNTILGQNYNNSIFNYSISTFGFDNYTNSHFYFIKNFDHLYNYNKNSTLKPNSNYIEFPNCQPSKQLFTINKSEFFEMDGLLNNNMKYTNYSYILEKKKEN